MVCLNCNCDFEIVKKGSGGHNRVFCYNCLPINNNRKERNKTRYELLTNYTHKMKLSRGCDMCGYNKCAHVLEWHHIDMNKEKEPSTAIRYSLNTYLKEIEKCVLLCANCHREIHCLLIGK